MPPRLHLPAAAADSVFKLDSAQSRHLIKVLRMRAGDALVVFDGGGAAYAAHIAGAGKDAVIQTGAALPPAEADGGRVIHIGQSVCAPAKMDWAIEKMTELGAATIRPLIARRSHRLQARQPERWQRLIIAACEQCGRNRLPALLPALPLDDWQPPAPAILLTPRARSPLPDVSRRQGADAALTLAVGSESGFSAEEEERLIARGFEPARLGARILRAETAAAAALAVFAADG